MNVSRIGKWQRSGNPGPSAAVPRGVDELGVPIPSAATAKAFEALDFFVELDSWAMQGAKLLDRLGKMEGGELLRTNYLNLKSSSHNGQVVKHLRSPDLENLRRELAHWRPYAAVCPQCRGEPKPACLACQGLPYVIKAVWNRAPEKLRQAVLAKTTAATG